MGALAQISELETRMGGPFVDDVAKAQAQAALEDVSDMVRSYGRAAWSLGKCPAVVKAITLNAAERRVRNPEGFASEQAGEYLYRLPKELPVGLELTDSEIRTVRRAAGFSELSTAVVQRSVRVSNQKYYPHPPSGDWWWAD